MHFVKHPDANVRGATVISLGHLARIHGRLDWRRIVPLLRRMVREDPDAAVSGTAGDALSDIRQFVSVARRLTGRAAYPARPPRSGAMEE